MDSSVKGTKTVSVSSCVAIVYSAINLILWGINAAVWDYIYKYNNITNLNSYLNSHPGVNALVIISNISFYTSWIMGPLLLVITIVSIIKNRKIKKTMIVDFIAFILLAVITYINISTFIGGF